MQLPDDEASLARFGESSSGESSPARFGEARFGESDTESGTEAQEAADRANWIKFGSLCKFLFPAPPPQNIIEKKINLGLFGLKIALRDKIKRVCFFSAAVAA